MAITINHDDITELKRVLDDRYVRIEDCNDKQEMANKKFATNETQLKLFEQKMESWEWVFKLIATGTVGTLITSILSLILK